MGQDWPYVETIHCAIVAANAPPSIEPSAYPTDTPE